MSELTPEETERARQLGLEIQEEADVKKIEELFSIFDRNGDGVLEKAEVRMAAKILMPEYSDDGSIDEMIEDMDLNQDGVIQLAEFTKIITDNN